VLELITANDSTIDPHRHVDVEMRPGACGSRY
jgi:hypothetical protein